MENLSELFKALSKAQSKIPVVPKSTQGYGYKYVDIATLMEIVQPILEENGLSIWHQEYFSESGQHRMRSHLCHTSGQTFYTETVITYEPNKPLNINQVKGSALTYARRYGIYNLLNIAYAEEDDDASSSASKIEDAKEKAKSATISKPETGKKSEGFTTMPFGEHKGKKLAELPKDYVKWFLNNPRLDKIKFKELIENLEEIFPEFKPLNDNVPF